jgi:hypothetical protein
MMKLILGIVAGLLAALLVGLIWGRSGRAEMIRAVEAAELKSDLLGARAAVLDARVAIYGVDFGQASKHLEDARGVLGRAEARLKSLGRDDEARQTETALTGIDDAQRLALNLDQNANSRAGEVAKAIADVLEAEAKR